MEVSNHAGPSSLSSSNLLLDLTCTDLHAADTVFPKWERPLQPPAAVFVATDSIATIRNLTSSVFGARHRLFFDASQRRYERGATLLLRERPGSVDIPLEAFNALKDVRRNGLSRCTVAALHSSCTRSADGCSACACVFVCACVRVCCRCGCSRVPTRLSAVAPPSSGGQALRSSNATRPPLPQPVMLSHTHKSAPRFWLSPWTADGVAPHVREWSDAGVPIARSGIGC